MLRKIVPNGGPVSQAMIACAPEFLMRRICASTLTSAGAKCSASTTDS